MLQRFVDFDLAIFEFSNNFLVNFKPNNNNKNN